MARTMKRLFLVLALALSCAHAPEAPPQRAPARPEPLPPPSSIIAVLAHRDELGLDDGQVAKLLELQKLELIAAQPPRHEHDVRRLRRLSAGGDPRGQTS